MVADCEVRVDGYMLRGTSIRTYFGYSKEGVIRQAKHDGDNDRADEISIWYKGSGKHVGFWEKRGTRWMKVGI